MMFPGQKEPLPAHKSQTQLWTELTRMFLFVGACTTIALSVRYIERKASDLVLNSASG